jgi:hypothetical protein
MDVSVVVPTRDRPELLALTLQSVLWQQSVDVEIIVVDDGAGSGTEVLIRHVADPRVRLLRNPGPPGVSGARNHGITASTGGWIAFLDDDDLWAPSKLTMQLAAARATGAGWVYAGDVMVDEELRVCGGAPPPTPQTVCAALRRHNAVPVSAGSTRRCARARTGTCGFVWQPPASRHRCHAHWWRSVPIRGCRHERSIGCWRTSRPSPHATAFRSIGPVMNDGPPGWSWRTGVRQRRCGTTPAP